MNVATTPLYQAIRHSDVEEVERLLLSKDVSVNEPDLFNETALFWAIHNDSTAIVRLLLTAGAEVNWVNGAGDTPLHLAAMNDSNAEIVRLLLLKGANLEHEAIDSSKPIDVAKEKDAREIVKILSMAKAVLT